VANIVILSNCRKIGEFMGGKGFGIGSLLVRLAANVQSGNYGSLFVLWLVVAIIVTLSFRTNLQVKKMDKKRELSIWFLFSAEIATVGIALFLTWLAFSLPV